MGFVFFFAQVTASAVCICLTAHERDGSVDFQRKKTYPEISIASALTCSVRETAFSMMGVCGFFVFFSLVGTALTDTLSALGFHLCPLFCIVLGGCLEISSGFLLLAEFFVSPKVRLLVGGALLGFGGISVFMQAIDRTEAIFFAPLKYLKGKLLTSMFCPLFSVLFFFLYERKSGQNLIIVSSVLIFFIFYLLNYVKIKFFSKKCGKIKRNAV